MTGAGNTSRTKNRKGARGILLALVGTNLAIVAVAALALYWHDRADDARWRIVTEYHMGVAAQARLALPEIELLRQGLTAIERYEAMTEPGPATPRDIEILRLETNDRLHTIKLASQTIEALQNRFAEARFAEATGLVVDGVTRLDGLGESWSENLASGEAAAAARNLELRLEQLSGLHLAAQTELAAGDYIDQPIGYRYLLLLFVALIVGGGFVSAVIVRRFEKAALAHGKAVAALHESDTLFKATFDQAAVGIALCTPDGYLDRVNERLCQILGYTAEELAGMSFKEITHPDDLEIGMDQNRRLRAGEISTLSTEKRYIRKDGKSTWANLTVSIVRDKSGTPQYLIAVIQDIDARKRAEEGAQRFRALFDQVSIGMLLRDSDGVLVSANDSFCKMLGYERDEIVGRRLREFTHPDDLQIGVPEHRRIAAGEIDSFSMEKRYFRKNGEIVWAGAIVSTVRDESGSARHTTSIVADITERKQAEDDLARATERLRDAQRIALIGSWDTDVATGVERWSDQLYRNLGLEPGSCPASSRNFLDRMHPEDRKPVLDAAFQAIAENIPFDMDVRVIWPDGSERIMRERAEPIVDAEGTVIGLSGTTEDITVQKQAEEELGRLNAELEDRVEERTAELRAAQEELVRSERLATLGQLTATVSHELRNPLGAMRTSMYIVEQVADMQDSRLSRSIDRINRSITRCDNIIDELLDFTRIRNLEPVNTRFDRWIASVLDEQPAQDGIEVKRKLGAPDTIVSADVNRLRRAIINVYENAFQAVAGTHGCGPAGRVQRVTIETRTRKNRLEIIVSDTGHGILPDTLPKIFEPLFSTKNFGVGLGLPTVKHIMEQHGGGISVTSKPGKGARFVLWLPLAPTLEAVE